MAIAFDARTELRLLLRLGITPEISDPLPQALPKSSEDSSPLWTRRSLRGISTETSSSPPGTFAPSGGKREVALGSSTRLLNRLWTNLRRLWMMLAVGAAYAYELRQSGQVVSTGRLTMEDQLALGDELTVAGILASVTELHWVGGESRLLLEPVPSPSRS